MMKFLMVKQVSAWLVSAIIALVCVQAHATLGMLGGSAQTFNYYISPTGSDSNSGTYSSPWALTAINTHQSTYKGHSVGLECGTYDAYAILGSQPNDDDYTPMLNIAGGSSGSPTIIQSVSPLCAVIDAGEGFMGMATITNGQTGFTVTGVNGGFIRSDGSMKVVVSSDGGMPVGATVTWNAGTGGTGTYTLSSAATASASGVLFVVSNATSPASGDPRPLMGTDGSSGVTGSGYITINGLEIKDAYGAGPINIAEQGAAGGAGSLYGIVIENNYIHDLTNAIDTDNNPAALNLFAMNGGLVQNNYITSMTDYYSRAVGIIGWGSYGSTITENSIIQTDPSQAGGIGFKDANNQNNTISANFVDFPTAPNELGNDGPICAFEDGAAGTYIYVENNVVIGQWPTLPNMGGVSGGYPSTTGSQYWINNTFLGIPASAHGMVTMFSASGLIYFYNNIIQRTTYDYWGDVTANAWSFAQIDYNAYPGSPELLLSPNGTTSVGTAYTSLSTWAAALPSGAVGKDAHSALVNSSGYGGATNIFQGGSPAFPSQMYKLIAGSQISATGANPGSTTGTTGGTATDMGAWGGASPPSQIGANFIP